MLVWFASICVFAVYAIVGFHFVRFECACIGCGLWDVCLFTLLLG